MDTTDFGRLVLRVSVGGTLAAHGAQKLFGWFGGHGVKGTAGFFEQIGYRPGRPNAIAAGVGEALGGSMLALGVATPLAGAAAAATMAVAASTHADKGFFAMGGGYEYPMVLGSTSAALALMGPGSLSVDRLLGNRWAKPWMGPLAVAAAVPAAMVVINRRKRAVAEAAADAADAAAEAARQSDIDLRHSKPATETTEPARTPVTSSS